MSHIEETWMLRQEWFVHGLPVQHFDHRDGGIYWPHTDDEVTDAQWRAMGYRKVRRTLTDWEEVE